MSVYLPNALQISLCAISSGAAPYELSDTGTHVRRAEGDGEKPVS